MCQCPFCGTPRPQHKQHELFCATCRLSFPTFRNQSQPASFAVARDARSPSGCALALLFVAIAISCFLRFWVDAPPLFPLTLAATIVALTIAAVRSGCLALVCATLFVVTSNYFLVDPIFSFGVDSWRGAAQLAQYCLIAALSSLLIGQMRRPY